MVSLPQRRAAVKHLRSVFAVSKRRACKVLGIHRSTESRHPVAKRDSELIRAVVERSLNYPRWGYRKIFEILQRDSYSIGRERVRLIRKREGLQVRRKQAKKRRGFGEQRWELQAEYPNHVWSYDFVEDATADGKRLRFLNIVDEFTRECLATYCLRSQNWKTVKQTLSKLFTQQGVPAYLRSDNGSELIAKSLREWLSEMKVQTAYIEPGSPWQNGYVESFNAIFRDECLNRWLFFSPREAQQISDSWRKEYNFERPHGSLNGATPAEFAQGYALSKQRQQVAA